MLSVFDALEEILSLQDFTPDQKSADQILSHLEQAVHETRELLPKLKEAGVVDSGALGMYIFFEGFSIRWQAIPIPIVRSRTSSKITWLFHPRLRKRRSLVIVLTLW
ncbi:MAG: DAK2 domain-containing protein [Desulfobacterales bacterium]|nr:DAK2 domain-containing protein [Desulfobacterales bacterium]